MAKKEYFCSSCGSSISKNSKSGLCVACALKKKMEKTAKEFGKRDKESFLGNSWWEKRIPIAKHAKRIYRLSDKPKKCCVCGYDKHYEVCHIMPVSEFTMETTLNEINDIQNLIALCRNCHWEYDNGCLII